MSREEFARAILAALGIPANPENIRALDAWMQAEGTSASNNPLATTQPWGGASNFNSVGVKNYSSPDDGVAATVKTLRNGLYDPILDALRHGSAYDVANAVYESPWGTGAGVIRVLGGTVQGGSKVGTGHGGGSTAAPNPQANLPSEDEVRSVFGLLSGRDPTDGEMAGLQGMSLDAVRKKVGSTQESQGYQFASHALTLTDILASGEQPYIPEATV